MKNIPAIANSFLSVASILSSQYLLCSPPNSFFIEPACLNWIYNRQIDDPKPNKIGSEFFMIIIFDLTDIRPENNIMI
jgi:hypothetical protein